jgi:hypothetical protein
MARLVFSVLICLQTISLAAPDGSAAATPLTGAWKLVETSGNGAYSQPSLYIFTARHFMSTAGGKSRPNFKSSNPGDATAAEKIAAYDTFVANTGSYELSGDTIVFNVLLAKLPNSEGTASPLAKLRFKIQGNT